MQAKTMIQAAAAVLVLTAAASWGNMTWTFNDGSAHGWVQNGGAAAEIEMWNGSNSIFTQVQNPSGGTCSLSITGLSQVIDKTSNYVQFSTLLWAGSLHTPYTFVLTTTNGDYNYDLIGESSSGGGFVNLQLNLFTNLIKQGAAPDLAVGDTITGLKFTTWGWSLGAYADNISLVVPEPASLALLALGGCCLLRRRR